MVSGIKSEARPASNRKLCPACLGIRSLPGVAIHRGATWTTDAPYRETEVAITSARQQGALAVEMEAAALYAFAAAAHRTVVCFAHVTNAMAQTEGDFEKGEADGATATLAIIAASAKAWSELD